jgi:hypothetical protein
MKKLFLLFVFYLLLVIVSYSQNTKSYIIPEGEKHIANKIFNHRITMFGEGIQHHIPTSHFNLIRILDNWLKKVESEESLNPNLTLILEFDSASVSYMDYYVKSGKIRPLLDFVGPNYPLELLEQLYEYNKIYKEIDSVNKTRKQKISFCLKGFEEIGDNIKESYFNMNREENELWFINERDNFTSKGIINYLKENPEQKAIIFYGSAHLQTGICNKNIWGPNGHIIPDEKCMGKWLAQYLIDEFGEKEINIVVSSALPADALSNPPFDELENDKFLLTKSLDAYFNLALKGVNQYLINLYVNEPTHNINFALSRYIIEKSIERSSVFEKFKGYKAGTGIMCLYNLFLPNGTIFRKSDDLIKWYHMGLYKGFAFLDSKTFYNNVYTLYLLYSKSWGTNQLIQLGFYPSLSEFNPKDESEWEERWIKELKNIKFLNAVEIFWVGYPDEQMKAKKYLKEFSGKDFDEPAQYLQWWRRDYCKFRI